MGKEEKKSSVRGSPYKELYNERLTKEQIEAMNFNLVNFVETLIAMDRQHQEWLEKQTDQTKQST